MKNRLELLNVLAEKEIKDSFSIISWDEQQFGCQPISRANYNHIFLVIEGTGNLRINDEIYQVSGNELFLLSKGQSYNFEYNTAFNGYEIIFGDCFWEKAPASAINCNAILFNNASANQHLGIAENDIHELTFHFNILHLEFVKSGYVNKPDVLAAYLKIIMIKIANMNVLLNKGTDSFENRLYRQFLDLLSSRYNATREVADYALLLGITSRKLTDLCIKCNGKGAKEIIKGQLIIEAKRALQFSSLSIKEIAYHLNFSTPYQFSHFFKKNALLSPHHYRSAFAQIAM